MKDAAITPVGVKPSAPDFCMISAAYGIEAAKPANLEEFARALQMAARSNVPYVIELGEVIHSH